MNNRKTLLFTLFTLSFILLFDSWQKFNGLPSLFMPEFNNSGVNNTVKKADVNSTTSNTAGIISTNSNSSSLQNISNIKPTILTTDLYKLEIDPAGAGIKSLSLLKYLDKDNKTPIELFGLAHKYSARSGLVNGPNHSHAFLPVVASASTDMASNDKLSFAFTSKVNDIELVKTYTLHKGSYVIDVDFTISNRSSNGLIPELYAELVRSGDTLQESMFYSTFTGPAVYTSADKFHKITFSDLDKQKASYPTSADNGWVGMVQHYFATSWIMKEQKNREFYAQNISPNLYRVGFKSNLANLAPNASVSQNIKLFAGPQQERMLENTATGLELVKDYGWVTMFAKPLFWLLEKIYQSVQNWGWSIIILTVLLKLVFFPLTASSQRSMGKMKDLQPKIMALKEQYANEPQKMQQEMLAIYRKEKVNPMGGCLPMMVQIPVFIALYFVLLSSIEMRGAAWLGWIHDLSKPDPLYILPVFMAVSMFLQMKLNPKPADPMQAKMMMIVPMVFSVMFFFFPAGLVLYYVVNNLITILQQYYINQTLKKPITK
ncbi:MAG: preprotein translocase, cooperates with SecYEG and SecDFyajC translocon, rane component [Pseudomonadota bacterium]|jgi:YidC/Oxa1 family membrane protein insertase